MATPKKQVPDSLALLQEQVKRLSRELEVEAALEKVRNRATSMRTSAELAETSAELFHSIKEIGIEAIRASVGIFDDPNDAIELWLTTIGEGEKLVRVLDYVNVHVHPVFENQHLARKRNERHACTVLSGKEVQHYYQSMSTYMALPKQQTYNEKEHFYSFFFLQGSINVIVTRELSDEQCGILARFANAFGLIYTRFLDLQKAEEQANEARIEASLERVRSRALAMHTSEELGESAVLLYRELRSLGVSNFFNCGFVEVDVDHRIQHGWMTHPDGNSMERFKLPLTGDTVLQQRYEAWLRQDPVFYQSVGGFELRNHIEYVSPHLQHKVEEMVKANFTDPTVFYCFNFSHGYLHIISGSLLNADEESLAARFARVFEITYRRFLDLKMAEAQAREAQIEAALERVRSRAMAMQRSEELQEVILVVMNQFHLLGFQVDLANFNFPSRSRDWTMWLARPGYAYPEQIRLPYLDHTLFNGPREAVKKGLDFFSDVLSREEGEIAMQHFLAHSILANDPPKVKDRINQAKGLGRSMVFGKHIALTISNYEGIPYTPEQNAVLRRFHGVFEQSYTRFLDLQNAEAQAREGQIQLAMERVRARTMAMQKSDELPEAANLLFQQVQGLGMPAWSAGYCIWDEDKKAITLWMSSEGVLQPSFKLPLTEDPSCIRFLRAHQRGETFYVEEIGGEELVKHYTYMQSLPVVGDVLQSIIDAGFPLPTFQIFHCVYFSKGFLLFITYQPVPEAHDIFKRFGKVFDQTYTRFLDLQKAEAQAREATLEASLERVRGKAMGMHNSGDLSSTVKIFYQELESLRLAPRRCGVGLLNRNNRIVELSSISQGTDDTTMETIGSLAMEGHPVLDQVYENYLKQQEYHAVLHGNEIKKYNQAIRPQVNFPDLPEEAVTYGYFFYVEDYAVYAWTDKELGEDEVKIYRRFASVLTLTFKRYRELKDAEERARIAVRDASLDRVRAEIASMRTADDLQRITPLIWRELTTLGVPFIRCGVMIVHEKEDHVDFYLSTPEGRPLAVLHLDSNGQEVTKNAMQHWRRQEVYMDHWNRDQFAAFSKSMMQQGQIESMSAYQGGELPPESLTLQFTPFAQGMLYVGSAEPFSTDQLELLRALADAFSTAYARYEDFNKLEAAKTIVENTLSELRTTQTQLVQSEKMASLGELTAGIAHEIQNPLNFVNNFSEVSKELLDEMAAELKKGNTEDAQQIARDVIQNLEKINFHGKRADGIVKSMLQHSRKSSGQKELTDINALCDEYLRLSYHGLRAKDKSFNAKFETDFDPSVGQINVLPQEIGRVILNLINNAFYAVSEKKKLTLDTYEPTVTVTTKKTEKNIEVRVRDNGTGIPQKALEKIFNPFFTTKPTGQGTGLGLSLSYDIITKGHGGELKVETSEGKGSTFTIFLPS